MTCDWDSSNSVIRDGSENYLVDMSIADCKEVYTHKYYVFEGIRIPVTFNGTVVSRDIFEVGSLDAQGYCQSGSYELNGFRYDNVLVKNRKKINVSDYSAIANTDTNTNVLRSGVTCPFSDSSCLDAELGSSMWEPQVPSGNDCLKHGVSLLYQGPALFIDSPHPTQPRVNDTYSTGQKYGLTFFRFLKLLLKLDRWVKSVRSVLKMFGQHSQTKTRRFGSD